MKIKKENYRYEILIKKEWYNLCACITCREVHAVHDYKDLHDVDEKIKCCKKPNNYYLAHGANAIIRAFIKKWGLEE